MILNRIAGAALRALLVVTLITFPSVMLPNTTSDTTLIVGLVAIIAAAFTFVEYSASSPSLVEFRDAPPFNRIRFGALFLTVFALTLILRGETQPSTLTRLFESFGGEIALALDFPYSPVRLVVLMLPDPTPEPVVEGVRTAAGLSYLVSILSLGLFVLVMRLRGWPARDGTFNVWVNLPTFDPTRGGDVVDRLRSDAQFNLILGFLLPFLIPALVKVTSALVDPIDLSNPHALIWTMTAWAFLPASMLKRGIALNRVADLISDQRKRESAAAAGSFAPV
ncbi:hypothetical protein [Wenxinia saemankumensis]|uniref:Uncharacterized protein n=1 Tax=Wenxinia saemankumensis TaxID=1447782 RepID=A0A1M6G0H6_9RHOB|nr:hypothetical protein [Wenxinia saemankumensis]SHJ03374.1 hypothetical protein SAMN05444417_2604 [Wenxinia saemankumensis]